jgi:flagellar basal-body rod modification protein FlgD
LGKQDFLKLLVTQLKNQDPLNPDNPTEFTAQLAQFSSLEQLYNLNTSMNGMVTANTTSNNVSALGLIGKQVTYAGSTLSFDGQPVQLGYTLDGSAAQVQLLIQDSTGNTIRTLPGTDVTSGNHLLTWDGLDQNGNPVQSGTYTVSVQAAGADGASAAASPLITSEVTGVDLSDSSGAILNTKAGNIAFSKVLGVGSAGSSANSILNQTTTESTTSSDSTTAAAASALASSMAQNATNTTSSIL